MLLKFEGVLVRAYVGFRGVSIYYISRAWRQSLSLPLAKVTKESGWGANCVRRDWTGYSEWPTAKCHPRIKNVLAPSWMRRRSVKTAWHTVFILLIEFDLRNA